MSKNTYLCTAFCDNVMNNREMFIFHLHVLHPRLIIKGRAVAISSF